MSSKYDFVKVKVTSGPHYFVLSRYLLSRMLMFSEIPAVTAVRIALDVKKRLVDSNTLTVTQEGFQTLLFQCMQEAGFGEHHVALFGTMTRFYHTRVPLVILLAGTGCCGKTTTAHNLVSMLNTHNLVHADVLVDILSAIDGPCCQDPLFSSNLSGDELVAAWEAQCVGVAKCLEVEFAKTIQQGKVLVVEGTLLNIALYAKYFTRTTNECRSTTPTSTLEKASSRKGDREREKEPRPIFMAFILQSHPDQQGVLISTWMASRSHMLPPLAYREQTQVLRARFDAVEQAHLKRVSDTFGAVVAPGGSDPHPLIHVVPFDAEQSGSAATTVHRFVLDEILLQIQ